MVHYPGAWLPSSRTQTSVGAHVSMLYQQKAITKGYPHSPFFLPSSFDCSQYAKRDGGKTGSIYHMNDINIKFYLGRQRGEGSPIERMSLRPYLVVSVSSTGFSNVRKAKNVLLVQN